MQWRFIMVKLLPALALVLAVAADRIFAAPQQPAAKPSGSELSSQVKDE